MTLDGEVVETTDEHPFYVVKTNDWLPLTQHGRWVEAGDLQPGDAILQADGETGAVLSVQVVAAPQWMYNLSVDVAHTFFVGQQQWLVHNCGAGDLPQMKGQPYSKNQKALTDGGFTQTRVTTSGNQTWAHADGSEVLIHPYGDVKTKPWKTANNAHLHKYSPNGTKLNDRGIPSTNPNETHIGIPNPPDLPTVRGRPHGAGVQ